MAQVVKFETSPVSDADLFTEYLFGIKLELETLKVMAWKKEDKALLGHMEKIDSSLNGITDLMMDIMGRRSTLN